MRFYAKASFILIVCNCFTSTLKINEMKLKEIRYIYIMVLLTDERSGPAVPLLS